ncbi:MFS transporter [Pseudomonas viridiflava ICMP 13104]|uniref:MFS transporter n=1 Tax=Pseudomonas viridiflava ICMP 13104 TaxID=1198305 RepID=A0A0W0H2Z8_PSEVI|nr:MFS transporter [Pseudomonas viridiflava ICMP 13104]
MREDVPRAVTTICKALQEQIEHGLLPHGSKLPAERKLSEVFDTTRITLREALLQLEAQGLIYREERRGWFISPPRLAYDLIRRSHFHAMVCAQGRVAHTQLLSARLQPASAMICEMLELPALSSVIQICRARRIDQRLVLLELPALSSVIQICRARRIDQRLVLYVEHYLRPELFPGILEHDLNESLTELYARCYDLHYGQVRFDMVPTALHAEAAAALKVSLGSPGLRIARVNYDRKDRLIDCDLEYWRHDAIHVRAEVHGD